MACCKVITNQSGGRKERRYIVTHLEMGGWVPLLSVDEARKLERRGRREEMKEGMEERREGRRDGEEGRRDGEERKEKGEGKGKERDRWRERMEGKREGKRGRREKECIPTPIPTGLPPPIMEEALERVYTSLPPPSMHSLTKVGSRMKKMGVLFPTRSQFPS